MEFQAGLNMCLIARLSYLSLYVHKSVIIIKNVVFVEWIAEHQSKARLVHRLCFMCSRWSSCFSWREGRKPLWTKETNIYCEIKVDQNCVSADSPAWRSLYVVMFGSWGRCMHWGKDGGWMGVTLHCSV